MSNTTQHARAHRIGVHPSLLIKHAPTGQPIITERRAIAPVMSVAVDVSS